MLRREDQKKKPHDKPETPKTPKTPKTIRIRKTLRLSDLLKIKRTKSPLQLINQKRNKPSSDSPYLNQPSDAFYCHVIENSDFFSPCHPSTMAIHWKFL